MPPHFIKRAEIKDVTVRQERDQVILIVNGKSVLSGNWRNMANVVKALQAQIKAAEEYEAAASGTLIQDQAILTRLGVPLGLTRHPDILREATKEAAWNSKLRRYIPLRRAGGIKSQAVFGTPTIKQDPPPTKEGA